MSRGPWFTAAFKTEVWRRWQGGDSCAEIVRALGTHQGPLHRLLRQRGGVAHLRYRSSRALSLSKREQISRGICAGESIRAMAQRKGRAPSSISREIARHGGRDRYRALTADRQAWRNAQRPKPCRLAQQPALALLVAQKLRLNWSPQQIAGWLAREFGNDDSRPVSHETICRILSIETRGALKKGAARAPASWTLHALRASLSRQGWHRWRTNPRCSLDSRAPRAGRRSRCP